MEFKELGMGTIACVKPIPEQFPFIFFFSVKFQGETYSKP